MFERCSLCFRVRMTAALKRLRKQETVVLDDDTDIMVGLFEIMMSRIGHQPLPAI
jgi:glutaredoxin 2